jgi:osmoprotectant transport system permease protein
MGDELLRFVAEHRAELLTRLVEHVRLVAISTGLAAAAGIPLGIAAAHRPSMARPAVALANLAQTIPSLALFGFLIPLPLVGGVGTRTALVALTLYAVLPILRGTITGIQGVERAVVECAVAMGMTPRQVRWQVEWPLARPAIFSGLRVAVVIGVGTATIASAIGAGGLGDYIFRGLAMVNATVILAGALPAAALALAADGLLAAVGRWSDPRRHHRVPRLGWAAAVIGGVGLAAGGWLAASPGARPVVVGSKNFTEQIVLGELLAQQIERRTGGRVDRRFNLGGTAIAHAALVAGDIDVYVEYTGTALTAIFGEDPSAVSDEVFARVRDRYARLGVTALPRLGFNNTFAILTRAEAASRAGVGRISDLSKVAAGWRAGFGYEFLERPDGFRGLAAVYGLVFAEPPRVMDLNLIYRALAAGEIDVTAGDATSGLIDALDLAVLEDDRQYFPVYDAVPVARTALLLSMPAVGEALRALEGRLSAATMRRLNGAVDRDRQSPGAVVRAFLDQATPAVPTR